MHDLRDAYRSLRAAFTVSLFAILSLGLGIGSSVAVFSIANALLFRTLPVHEPERLALVAASTDGRKNYWATYAAWEQVRDRRLFESAFAWSHKKLDLSERGESELIDGILASEELAATLGGQALFLASLGLYGVTAHAVGLRRREIGIRMALGADARLVARAVTERIAILIGVGVAAGAALALWAAPVVESLVFGLEPRDPSTFAFAAALLVAVAAGAAFLPAHRAARLDPASLLRDSSGVGPGA